MDVQSNSAGPADPRRALGAVTEVLRVVNAHQGTGYAFKGRFSTGEWGAYRIDEPGRRPVVLKFFRVLQDTNLVDADPDLAGAITDHLRSLGYPTPRHLHAGRLKGEGLYRVMEELPGRPLWQDPTPRLRSKGCSHS